MNAKDSLLIAQLSQVTIEFLAVLNRERRQNTLSRDFLDPLFARAGYNQKNSLINQGTIIGHAYLTIVWLWEQQSSHFTEAIPNFPLDNPVAPWPNLSDTVIYWERHISQPSHRYFHSWLRHVRNALSHGRVSFDPTNDDLLVFADAINKSSDPHTIIQLSPAQLGLIANLVIKECEQRTDNDG